MPTTPAAEFEPAPLSAYEGTDSAVLATAWGYYKARRETYRYPGDAEGFHRFIPDWFAHSLRRAQDEADKAARKAETDRVAAELAARIQASRNAALDRLSDEKLSARISAIHDEIYCLQFANAADQERDLRSELRELEAEFDRRLKAKLDAVEAEGRANIDRIIADGRADLDRRIEAWLSMPLPGEPVAGPMFSGREAV